LSLSNWAWLIVSRPALLVVSVLSVMLMTAGPVIPSEGIATTRRTRTPNATRVRSRLGIFFHLPARLVVLQRDQELLERHDRLLPCRCLRLRAEQRQGCLGQSSDDGGGLAGVDDRPTGALHLLRKHFLLVVEPVGGADDQHVQDADRDDGDEDERDVRGPREVV